MNKKQIKIIIFSSVIFLTLLLVLWLAISKTQNFSPKEDNLVEEGSKNDDHEAEDSDAGMSVDENDDNTVGGSEEAFDESSNHTDGDFSGGTTSGGDSSNGSSSNETASDGGSSGGETSDSDSEKDNEQGMDVSEDPYGHINWGPIR